MSFKSLPKDIVQYLSKYIGETPEEWEVFAIAFDNSNQATQQKKHEVLNRDAWLEICFDGWDGVSFEKVYLEKPTIITRIEKRPMWYDKYFFIQVKVKDVVDHYNKSKYKKVKVLASRDDEGEYECYTKDLDKK